mgnify:CR=1 FL=1
MIKLAIISLVIAAVLALLGFAIRIDPPAFCPFVPRDHRVRFDVAICFETSSSNISTVVYPKGFSSHVPVFIIVPLGDGTLLQV